MAPKDSKKRKTDDSSAEAKKCFIPEKKQKMDAKQDLMSDDDSVASKELSSPSKLEQRELKELLKNHMIGGKLLNINTDVAKPERQELIENLVKKGLVEVAKEKTVTIKSYRLTEEGINQATPKEYMDDLARKPKTDKDLHDFIKKWAYHPKTGAKMFDILLEKTVNKETVEKKELAKMLGTESTKTNFFYTLQQMKTQGYVQESDTRTLRLRKKAFVDGKIPYNDDGDKTQDEVKEEVEKTPVI